VSSDRGIEQSFVDDLLALPTSEQRSAYLRSAGLLDSEGLDRLLEEAERLIRSDPGRAQRLADLCVDLADDADASSVVPRADYIRVQTHFARGEFDAALRFVESAREGYVALGEGLKALRTNIGRMALLLERGRYREALAAGRVVLDALDEASGGELDASPREAELLTATVHLNRGGCYEYMGLYQEALDAYAAAEESYRALGMPERVGEVLDNRSAVLLHLGRGSEALAVRESAAVTFRKAGLTLSFAKALANIGYAHLHLGNFTRSLETFERTRRLLESLDAQADKCLLLRDTANAYLELNLYPEAIATYREADRQLEEVGMAHDRAEVLWGLGSALIARSELEEAEEALAEAVVLFEEAGNRPLLSGVQLEQASLQAIRGDRDEALATARRALDLVSGEEWPVQQIYACLRLADLLLPDAAAAEPYLLEARRLAGPLGLPQLRYRLDERLGRLRLLQGRDMEAEALLEAAVEEIERFRGTVSQETMRASFLQDKTAAYEDLLRLRLARSGENPWQAFAVAEHAKSRALVDLLTGVAEKRSVAADPELEERLRGLQADLNATYSQMLGGAGEGAGASLQALHDRAAGLETEIGRLRLRAAADSSDPFTAPVAAPDDIRERYPSDATLLAYHVVGEEVLAFVVAGDDVRVVRRLTTVASARRLSQKLAVQWERFRAGGDFAKRHMAVLERSTRQVLAALYGELVEPLEPALAAVMSRNNARRSRGIPRLVVVPHGPLHQVPFHALFDGERYLLERLELSYAPSTTVYALCQERASRGSGRALALGVEDPSIPAAAAEARAVAKQLLGAGVRVGEEATVAALRAEASGCDVLHLACHGLFRAGNPMFSSLKLYDGWLTAADAVDLDLAGALVTLSACESGRGEVIGGDEVLGLARAFLGAGAATLVVSLWLAHDTTTAALMEAWYARMEGGTERAPALRAAQLEVKEDHPHPYYWAPFVLIGRG